MGANIENPIGSIGHQGLAGALYPARPPILRRLVSGGFWSLVGDAGSRVLAFAAAIVAARWLGVGDFGAFALIQSTVGMLMTLAVSSIGHTSTRYIALCRDAEPERIEGISGVTLRFAALTGLVAAFALFAAAPIVATGILGTPQLEDTLRMVAPVLLFCAMSGAMSGTVLGFEAFRRQARLAWLASLINFLAIAAGVMLAGLRGAVIGLVASEALRCLLVTWLAHTVMREKGFRLFGRLDRSEARMLWQFSLPLLLGSLLHAPVLWVCQVIIARQPGGIEEIGMYDAAQKWMTVVILIPMAASAAVGPVLANVSGSSDRSIFKRTTVDLAFLQLGLVAVPAALVALFSPTAVRIFGASFSATSPVVVILMVLAPIFVLKHLYWQTLTAGGHAWAAHWLAVLWAVIAVSLTWFWQSGGALALAWSMLIAYGVTLAVSVMLVAWIWRS